MSSGVLVVVRDGVVATLTLMRPEQRNALNTELRDAITATLAELENDSSVSVVMVTGQGGTFCAGFDLKEFQQSSMAEVLGSESASAYHEALRTFAKPLVGAINGPALAGGFDVAMLCDVRIASETASFGHPEVKFGSGVMLGPLADAVGAGVASDLALTGRTISASEALRLGIVSQVVPSDELLDQAMETARIIAGAPLNALVQIKRGIIARRS